MWSAHSSVHAHGAHGQPGQQPSTPLVVGRDGAVSGVVVKPVEVFAALGAEVERTCEVLQKLVLHP